MIAPAPPIDYNQLDPGIRSTVRWLRDAGFNTIDSGDGITKAEAIAEGHAMDAPHVFIRVTPERLSQTADVLLEFVQNSGFQVSAYSLDADAPGASFFIEAHYSPVDGIATVCLIGRLDADAASTTPATSPTATRTA